MLIPRFLSYKIAAVLLISLAVLDVSPVAASSVNRGQVAGFRSRVRKDPSASRVRPARVPSAHSRPSTTSVSRVAKYQTLAHVLLTLINKERRSHGVSPLWFGVKLSACAQRHSEAMSHAGYLFHDLSRDTCVPHWAAGENIAEVPGAPAQAVVTANKMMMAEGPCPSACPPGSATWAEHGHYLNLLSGTFHRGGIGLAVGRGETWITEDFTN